MQLKANNTHGGDRRIDHITLIDTGEFYRSFKVSLSPDYDLLITSQPQKEDTNLIEQFGEDIIGLTDESLDKLRSMIRFIALNYVRRTLDIQ
jgi:hypothetical protein